MVITQPMPRPATWAEFQAVKPFMIDTLGRLLVSEFCRECRATHFTVEPHITEVPCPDCGSTRTRCLRPSEHEASTWHASRIILFDQLRDAREAAGIPQVALWPADEDGGLLDLLEDYELPRTAPSSQRRPGR